MLSISIGEVECHKSGWQALEKERLHAGKNLKKPLESTEEMRQRKKKKPAKSRGGLSRRKEVKQSKRKQAYGEKLKKIMVIA